MTTALTQTQWRIVVAYVWVTAQAVRRSTSRLKKERALVSPAQRIRELLETSRVYAK